MVGAPRRVPGGPFAVAVGEGAVWVASGDGSVRAYDPRRVRQTGATATVPGANGLAVGDGGVWVSSRRAGTVTRVDPRTRRAGPPIRVGRGPADIAVGFGSVWVANADGGTVSRIDSRGGRAGTPIAVGARQVLGVTVGEGRVWVARAGGPNADRPELVQIDPEAGKVVGEPIAVPGAVPLDLVAGDGVWVTDSGGALEPATGARGGVTRVDPATGAVAGPPLRTGDRPVGDRPGGGRRLGRQRGLRDAHADRRRPADPAETCDPQRRRGPGGPRPNPGLFGGGCYLMKPVPPTALRMAASDLRTS